jgi:alkylation response protein AidB-like acyl-CoA dehydrogenase
MDFALTKEQEELRQAVLTFAQESLNEGVDRDDENGAFPAAKWKACADFGLLGLPIAADYGGQGASLLTTIVVMEALGKGCVDNGLVFSLNAQLWSCQMPIMHYGSELQKREWLTRLVSGEVIAAHAVSEPGAGSDVFSLKSKAERVSGGYVLTGSKTFSTNAPVAGLAVAFAYLRQPENNDRRVLTTFLVPRDTPGATFGNSFSKMGLRTSPMGEISFDECFVPESARLGPEGAGVRIFNSAMEWERACIFAAHVGAMDRLLGDCVKYSRSRRQFDHPIAKYESIANRIVDIKVAIEAGRFLIYYVGWLHGRGKGSIMESAIAKLFVSEAHKQAALDAVQIFGGYGYMKGNAPERELRDALSGTLYSGTSEMQRKIIARCLGL